MGTAALTLEMWRLSLRRFLGYRLVTRSCFHDVLFALAFHTNHISFAGSCLICPAPVLRFSVFQDVDPEHVKIVMKELGEEEEEKKEAGGAEQGVDGDEGDKALKKISFEAFKAWYDTSEEATILKERKASMEEEKTAGSAENEEGEEEEEGFSLVWPETTRARVWYS